MSEVDISIKSFDKFPRLQFFQKIESNALVISKIRHLYAKICLHFFLQANPHFVKSRTVHYLSLSQSVIILNWRYNCALYWKQIE